MFKVLDAISQDPTCGAAGPYHCVALRFVDLELASYSAIGLTWPMALSFDDA